jgi:hypothetical protein
MAGKRVESGHPCLTLRAASCRPDRLHWEATPRNIQHHGSKTVFFRGAEILGSTAGKDAAPDADTVFSTEPGTARPAQLDQRSPVDPTVINWPLPTY